MRVSWADINARCVSEECVTQIYLRQSGLLEWQYDAIIDAPEIERENPLLRQQRDMDDP